jgi:hypothetical protein
MNADQSINHPKKKDKNRHNTRRNRHGCNHWLAQLVEREAKKERLGGNENVSSPVDWVEDERGNLVAADGSYFPS